jgi:hypothetical protein
MKSSNIKIIKPLFFFGMKKRKKNNLIDAIKKVIAKIRDEEEALGKVMQYFERINAKIEENKLLLKKQKEKYGRVRDFGYMTDKNVIVFLRQSSQNTEKHLSQFYHIKESILDVWETMENIENLPIHRVEKNGSVRVKHMKKYIIRMLEYVKKTGKILITKNVARLTRDTSDKKTKRIIFNLYKTGQLLFVDDNIESYLNLEKLVRRGEEYSKFCKTIWGRMKNYKNEEIFTFEECNDKFYQPIFTGTFHRIRETQHLLPNVAKDLLNDEEFENIWGGKISRKNVEFWRKVYDNPKTKIAKLCKIIDYNNTLPYTKCVSCECRGSLSFMIRGIYNLYM